ncbi:hypothetical protein FM076_15735 [Streptomyces albus subsp. chlorinus]|uniref:hypothetical protein n=1 Tax=Streptomyces albus TaxID=1888 RepID=UPI00156E23E8|nr:hypothetical protein [Streptomyces albus]NSC22550.1 hypothetical protein [Streptomyces albus subsp. chlorinus]
MRRRGQRLPVRPEATEQVRLFLTELRALADASGLSDGALARELGIQAPQFSKLLSGAAMLYRHTKALHAVSARLADQEVISLDLLLHLHDEAVFSSPERYKKEFRRAKARQRLKDDESPLPVPTERGDRRVRTQAERFLLALLEDKGAGSRTTLDVLNAGADVLGPPEVATVLAGLRHRGESALADDFAQICGREQDRPSVIHAARDLIDPHGMANLAARLLTASMSSGLADDT